ncbi:MAG: TIR domain-containing protein [Pirellulaceae bacterium]
MDVLISWSKTQSRAMASLLYGWLPKVVPGYRPWMSSKDIDKGKQWFGELQDFLSDATSCIICVTSENVRSPWIYYETGAIAAKKQDVLVCPYLVGIGVSMIADGPFAQYQCTEATKDDTLALIRSLNKALARPHDEGLLFGNFENKWPEFEQELSRILEIESPVPADFVETEADILAGYKLSAEARKVLVMAAATDGYVMDVRDRSGAEIRAGNVALNDPSNRRSTSIWEQAIKDLVEYDLLSGRGHKGEVFEVSAKGYEVADVLRQRGEM